MTVDRNNHLNPSDRDWSPESLPAEFEADAIEVDRLIAHAARAEARHVPAGLSQRVFEMSVGLLPNAHTTQSTQRELRLVGAESDVASEFEVVTARRPRMFAAWARLALAASVLLVAGLTMWTTWPTHITPIAPQANSGHAGGHGGGSNGATGGSGLTPRVTNVAFNLDDLNALNARNPSAYDSYDGDFGYLLDASELRSFDDLNDDLVLLVQQLEM